MLAEISLSVICERQKKNDIEAAWRHFAFQWMKKAEQKVILFFDVKFVLFLFSANVCYSHIYASLGFWWANIMVSINIYAMNIKNNRTLESPQLAERKIVSIS